TWWPRWFVSAMEFRIKTITGVTACALWKGRMILPAWPRSCDGGIHESCLKREPQILTQRNFRRKMLWKQSRVVGQPLRLPNLKLASAALALQAKKKRNPTFGCPT